jgi:long-chain fatty acid transport protein
VRALAACLAPLSLAAAAGPAAANPADAFGFGARAAAMAGAHTAAAEDGSATYYNPALLARFAEIRIDVGYQVAVPTLTADGHDLEVDPSRGLALGLVVPGRVAGRPVAIGAGVFLPDQHITRTRALPSPQPRFALYDNRPQRFFLSADVAVEILPGLTVGGGIAYLSSTHGDVALRGLIGFPQAERSDLELAIDVDLETVRYPHLGAAWRVTPWLDLGVSYRGGFRLLIEQGVRIDGDVGLPELEPVVEDGFLSLFSASQDLFQPAQLTAGLAARITPRTAVAFDLGWHRWSAFENPAARIEIDLDVGMFNDFVDLPPALPLPAPHYHDIVVPRLGVEHRAWQDRRGRVVRARGGYVYEPSPAPEQFGETNFIDNHKHGLSLGAGLELPGLGEVIPRPVSVDAFVALTLLEARDHQKLSPIDPIGDYRSDGRVLAAGLQTRWRF